MAQDGTGTPTRIVLYDWLALRGWILKYWVMNDAVRSFECRLPVGVLFPLRRWEVMRAENEEQRALGRETGMSGTAAVRSVAT